MFHLANPQNHYFTVEDDALKAEFEARGCIIFSDINDLYKHVAQATGLEVCEVEGSEYYVKNGMLIDDRGFSFEPEDNVSIVDEVVSFLL